MALDLMSLAIKIGADIKGATDGMAKVQKAMTGTGKLADKFAGGLKAAFGGVVKAGAAMGAGIAAATASVTALTTAAAGTTDRIDKMSQKIGVSRQTFQEFDFIMSQSGGSVESLQVGMKTLRNTMSSAAGGGKEATAMFAKLGISVQNSDGSLRNQEDVMFDTIRALQGMKNETKRAELATKLFGKAGIDMIPLLNSGVGSIDEMRQKAHDLGLVIEDDAVDAGVRLTDTIDQCKRSFDSIRTQIGVKLMPIVQNLLEVVINNMPTIKKVLDVVFDLLGRVVKWSVTWIGRLIGVVRDFVTAFVEKHGAKIVKFVQAVRKRGRKFLRAAIQRISETGQKVGQVINSKFGGVFRAVKNIVKRVRYGITHGLNFAQILSLILSNGKKQFGRGTFKNFAKNYILPALKQGLEAAFGRGDLAKPITDGLVKAVETGKRIFNGVKAAFVTVVDFVKTHKDTIISVLAGVAGAFVALKAAVGISSIISGVGKATGVISKLFAVLAANPFTAIIVILGAVIGYLVNLYRTNEDFRDKVNGAWDSAKKAIKSAWEDHIKPALQKFKTFITDTAVPALQSFWNDTVKPVAAYLRDRFVSAFKAVSDFIKDKLIPTVKGIGSRFGDFWHNTVEPFGAFLKDTFLSAWEGIKTFFSDTLPGAVESAKGPLGEFYENTIKPIGQFIGHAFIDGWNAVKTFFTDTLPGAVESAKGPLDEFYEHLIKPMGQFVGHYFTEAWQGISDFWVELKPKLEELKTAFDGFYNNTLKPIGDFVGHFFIDTWNKLVGLFTGGEGGDGVEGAAKSLGQTFEDIRVKYLEPVATFIGESMLLTIQNLQDVLSGLIEFVTAVFQGDWRRAWNAITRTFGNIFWRIVDKVKAPINKVINFLNDMIEKVQGALNTVIGGINNALHINIPAKQIKVFGEWVGFPGWEWSPGLPSINWGRPIPMLAKGGIVKPGGAALVGEAGAELLRNIGGRAVVTPIGGQAGGGNTFNIYQQPGEDGEALARRIERILARNERQRRAALA